MAKRNGAVSNGDRLRRIGVLVGLGLVAVTVAQELRKPAAERTWHGDWYGIPYDYRMPTVEKVKTTHWSPTDTRVLMPKWWGVGWDVNVGRVVHLASEAIGGTEERTPVETGEPS